MPRPNDQRKRLRAVGSQGGRPKKLCNSPESPSEYHDIRATQFPSPSPTIANIPSSQSDPNSSLSQSSSSGSTNREPSKSTLWRRAQRERENARKQQELEVMSGSENWEDIEREVEEKWPMVTKAIRETVLMKGIPVSLISQG